MLTSMEGYKQLLKMTLDDLDRRRAYDRRFSGCDTDCRTARSILDQLHDSCRKVLATFESDYTLGTEPHGSPRLQLIESFRTDLLQTLGEIDRSWSPPGAPGPQRRPHWPEITDQLARAAALAATIVATVPRPGQEAAIGLERLRARRDQIGDSLHLLQDALAPAMALRERDPITLRVADILDSLTVVHRQLIDIDDTETPR
ncbi:hypothetical protein [Nocardia sp. NPDC052566]|uniref:hypothetical protein n=1 Tax=Nocardia sp. NPDC052566 TaxID=3364330 RepID=UPI0037C894C8